MATQSGRDLGEVLTDIVQNLERLVRAHIRLEAAGVFESVATLARGAGLVAAGGLLALLATLLGLLSGVARLSELMRPWEALLLVATGTALVSALVVTVGIRKLRGHPVTLVDTPRGEQEPWPTGPLA